MKNIAEQFLADAKEKTKDRKHRNTINFNIGKYNASFKAGKQQFFDIENARERAKNIKWQAIENLDVHLEKFESSISARGAKVLWAEDVAMAQNLIGQICAEKNCQLLVKSKSMVTEEIHLNEYLEKQGIISLETDLGEYIQQLDGEGPYHIVTPAMHKSREDVAKLFAEKLGTAENLSASELTLIARDKLRSKYAEAEVGVTGANFIISDIGGIAITENEGNARLCASLPKTHIVIVGIEKVIPSIMDLPLFWPLLSSFGTGQQITSYNTIITGPRSRNEVDGPEEMIVILLDNGRTNILANATLRESLYCIRCGACLNACPVYKNIGGHSYKATYSGPIGAVITPHLMGQPDWKHLSHASSLCGNCTEVCPMRINLHELLLENRHLANTMNLTSYTEKMLWKIWRISMLKRSLLNRANGNMKSAMLKLFGSKWSKQRSHLLFPQKSFNEQWKDKQK